MDEVIQRSSRQARQLYFPIDREIYVNSERTAILLFGSVFVQPLKHLCQDIVLGSGWKIGTKKNN